MIGRVYVSGAGSTWKTTGVLIVGQSGLGLVRLDGGAAVDVLGELMVGSDAGSAGTVLLNSSSSLRFQGATIGSAGNGTVVIDGAVSTISDTIWA